MSYDLLLESFIKIIFWCLLIDILIGTTPLRIRILRSAIVTAVNVRINCAD